MRLPPLCCLAFFLHFLAAPARSVELEELVKDPGLWQLTPDDFATRAVPKYREDLATKPFRWVSDAHDSARAAGKSLTVFGLPVAEAIARFSGGRLTAVTLSLYARGDSGELPKEQYEALIRNTVAALGKQTQAKFTVRGKDPAGAVRADGLLWQTAGAQYLLEYSATKEVKTRNVPFRAEFVRLELTPPPAKSGGLFTNAPAKAKFRAGDHVDRKSPEGDVIIPDVPMVNQGRKGYCVVACAERVMRYYGVPVDENELAQVANSDAERGTSSEAMLAAVKKLGARLHVRVRQVEDMDVKAFLALLKDYNRAAKHAGKAPLPDPGQVIQVAALYAAMDPELLKEVRTHNKAELGRFQRDVQAHVDQGIPLLWSVQLGLVHEPGLEQASGGHMRLIIGYNLKTSEVLYTDSWGAGHEKKRMAVADAWTITKDLAAIEPL